MAGGGSSSRGSEEEEVERREEAGAEEGGDGGAEGAGRRKKKGSGGKARGVEEEEMKEEARSGEEEEDEEEEEGAGTTTTSSEDAASSSNGTPTSTAALVVKQMPSSSRAMRNMAEKMRRDKLNTYIGELATLVPMVSSSPRRLDKTSVLRLSATFLRMHRTLIPPDGSLRPFLPKALKAFNLSEKVLEDMDGFLLVVMASGKIVFVSQHVERLLGHTQNCLLGQSVYGITHPDDHKLLASNLSAEGDGTSDVKEDSDAVNDVLATDSKCCPGPSTERDQSHPSVQSPSCSSSSSGSNRRLSFYVRLSQKAVGRGETAGYEMVHIVGQLRSASSEETQAAMAGKDLGHAQSTSSGLPLGEAVMVAVARVCRERQILELSLMEACKDEYLTRHGIHGEILNCDHRISVIAGYMADEVKGQSAFSFMHDQDARWTFIALQKMFSSADGFGNSCYRLKSKTGQYIYLRTYGHCEFDRVTGKFDTFVCVNTLVSEEEGKKAVEEMRQRYSASISDRAMGPRAIMDSVPTRALGAPFSKPVKPVSEETQEVALTSSSHQIISTSQVRSSPSKANQTVCTLETQSTELIVFESGLEEIATLTPKSYSSTSSPPPLVPISYPTASPPPYLYDPSLPIEASHPLPFSPSKTATRGAERQFCPIREGACLPGGPNASSLKRPPSNSSPHTRPTKRLQHTVSLEPQSAEPAFHGSAPASWPHMSCSPETTQLLGTSLPMSTPETTPDNRLLAPVGGGGGTTGRDSSSYNSRLLEVEGGDCGRPSTFTEEENRLPGWGCNDVRPSTFDLSSLDRNTDFPDLREDVEQLEILSMEVEPELTDPHRWELPSMQQMQESQGGIVLPDNVIASTEEQSVEETLHGGIRRSHRRLRLRLDSQGRTMASLERELSGLAGSHVIGGDLARLRVERKKQMHMLHTLEQEHRSSIATQEKTKAYGMQNVGV